MEGWQDTVFYTVLFGTLVWLHLHPSKAQRERAMRTQEICDWDWRA